MSLIKWVFAMERNTQQAHIFVCFLAYVLWKTIEQWQQRVGLGRATRTTLDKLGRIQSSDVVLPLADGSERELRLRRVVRPARAPACCSTGSGWSSPHPSEPRRRASKYSTNSTR